MQMENDKYLNDLRDIKTMMAASSQFLSLSGLSGVLAGIYALTGAAFAFITLPTYDKVTATYKYSESFQNKEELTLTLIIMAIIILVASIATGFVLSKRKAKKQNQSLWNTLSKKLLYHIAVPLCVGGLFCAILIAKEYFDLIVPSMLIFYGLGCVSASRYTFKDINYLGLSLLATGILSVAFEGYGLLFWSFGFGLCHIMYGTLMYVKYERN
jgi:uncharacterized membrane protein YidH (DUF202 family)